MDYKELINELGQWIVVLLYFQFIRGCYLLWKQTYQVSQGHYIVGQLAIVLLTMSLTLIIAAQGGVVTLGRLLFFAALNGWLYWNYWWFQRYPIPEQFLRFLGREVPDVESGDVYVPKTAFARYMTQETQKDKPIYFQRWFRQTLFWVIGGLLFVLAIGRVAEMYGRGVQKGVEIAKEAQDSTVNRFTEKLDSVKTDVKQSVKQVADTLKKGQDRIEQKAVSSSLEVKKKLEEKEKQEKEKQKKTDAKLNNISNQLFRQKYNVNLPGNTARPTAPKWQLQTDKAPKPATSPKSQPVPTRRRSGGSSASVDESGEEDYPYADSLIHASIKAKPIGPPPYNFGHD